MCVNCSVTSGLWNSMHGLSLESARQVYRSGLPFPSSWDYPQLGMEPGSPVLQVDSLPSISLSSLYCQTSIEMNMMFIRLSQISVVGNLRNIKQGLWAYHQVGAGKHIHTHIHTHKLRKLKRYEIKHCIISVPCSNVNGIKVNFLDLSAFTLFHSYGQELKNCKKQSDFRGVTATEFFF